MCKVYTYTYSGLRMMTTIAEAVKYISTLGKHNKLGGV